jgi:hypothetical protein
MAPLICLLVSFVFYWLLGLHLPYLSGWLAVSLQISYIATYVALIGVLMLCCLFPTNWKAARKDIRILGKPVLAFWARPAGVFHHLPAGLRMAQVSHLRYEPSSTRHRSMESSRLVSNEPEHLGNSASP